MKKNLLSVIRKEKRQAKRINFIFCNDKFLHAMNEKFLKHDTLTDIITFQYPGKKLTADIYISIPRVRENAKKYEVPFENELHRVMIHGVLHLCGYRDKKKEERKKIRAKEDLYLRKFGKE